MTRRKHINELVQERRNSIANALELRLSWTNPLISLSADGLAPFGARPSAHIVMTKFRSHVYDYWFITLPNIDDFIQWCF